MVVKDGLRRVDKAKVSRECAKLGYFCQSTVPNDYIVRRVRWVVNESVGPHAKSAECARSVRTLACISVYPECLPESHLVVESIPSFSKTLYASVLLKELGFIGKVANFWCLCRADIGRACDVSADALSERLLKALKHEMHGDRVLRSDEYVSMDVLVFAAFVLTVWCMGWYMVRQWSHAMHHSFADLAPTHILSEQPSAVIQIADDKC
ncbi:hypothetical protein LPJ77_000303 [Coemansia sp. RSA 2523]|nr:hypothetical protein LPJ54_000126 [Coemansia sp. RSA 1824]KAJ1811133.1 hypothetical protein LPJ77_000303 [Coemansia sp. RSA 2523]KAJ2251300.1 hypothetical protein GGH97_000100 [Coemansia sp. RSA 475]KAJ2258426.1 hypothetical protein GGH98_000227 [Coemansia sp. RSA 454]KAJ2447536.1 hypothetical protein IWW46_000238 [Coemansia sp. RSA 2440]